MGDSIPHIYREENGAAHQLPKLAIDYNEEHAWMEDWLSKTKRNL